MSIMQGSVSRWTITQRIWGRLQRLCARMAETQRAEQDRSIPKCPLRESHVKNCQLLLDRVQLLKRLKSEGVVAELGVDHAAFSESILTVAKPERLHLVDTWGSDRYHDALFRMVAAKFEQLIRDGQVCIHRTLSVDAASDFEDGYFDWIYIDTDHSYETTRAELELYASKVKADGVIAGHDYTMGNWVSGHRYGVIEAVHEFCVNRDWELVYLTIEPTEHQSFAIRRVAGRAGAEAVNRAPHPGGQHPPTPRG